MTIDGPPCTVADGSLVGMGLGLAILCTPTPLLGCEMGGGLGMLTWGSEGRAGCWAGIIGGLRCGFIDGLLTPIPPCNLPAPVGPAS